MNQRVYGKSVDYGKVKKKYNFNFEVRYRNKISK